MNKIEKLRHELNYLKVENIFQIFVFLISIFPSIVYTILVKSFTKKNMADSVKIRWRQEIMVFVFFLI